MVASGPTTPRQVTSARSTTSGARATAGWVRLDPSTQTTRVGTSPEPSRTAGATAAAPEPGAALLGGRQHGRRVGMSAVEPLRLAAQGVAEPAARFGDPLPRAPRPRAVGAPGPPPVAERAGEQRDGAEGREEQQLRSEEEREGDRDGHRGNGRDPRDTSPMSLGWGCGTMDLDVVRAHRGPTPWG